MGVSLGSRPEKSRHTRQCTCDPTCPSAGLPHPRTAPHAFICSGPSPRSGAALDSSPSSCHLLRLPRLLGQQTPWAWGAATPVQAASTLRSLLASAPIAMWRPEGASQRSQATLLLCLSSPGTFQFTQNRIQSPYDDLQVPTYRDSSFSLSHHKFPLLFFPGLSPFLKCAGYSLASGPLHLLL